jgi:hypothetical protein
LQFISEPDPFLAELKWVMTEIIRIEAEAKVGTTKGKYDKKHTPFFSRAKGRELRIHPN